MTRSTTQRRASDWVRILAAYREPTTRRSLAELALTIVPFAVIWGVAGAVASDSPWIALGLSVLNATFLVRIFAIQHDCGHGAFFRQRSANTWVGRALGVLTLTPYDVWRHGHSIHHASAGNLDKRGTGDIHTMTLREYRALSPGGRVFYQIYRHPLMLLGAVPTLLFVFRHRLPVGFMQAGAKYWVSAMGTNLGIALIVGGGILLLGAGPFLLIYLPTTLLAATIGVWMFYVQHQFEETFWDEDEDWQLHHAALHGSSYYVMPPVLQWLTANLGIHHVHHLNSRIPFYRLTEVLRDHPELAEVSRLTLRESLACFRLRLWDEERRELVPLAGSGAMVRHAETAQ